VNSGVYRDYVWDREHGYERLSVEDARLLAGEFDSSMWGDVEEACIKRLAMMPGCDFEDAAAEVMAAWASRDASGSGAD
jgi:hypothetical protein